MVTHDAKAVLQAYIDGFANGNAQSITIGSLDTIALDNQGLIKVLKGYWGLENIIEQS